MKTVFLCAYKIIGSPIVVLTKEEAEKWVSEDPESRYYSELPVETIDLN